jgi:hypothetical protein
MKALQLRRQQQMAEQKQQDMVDDSKSLLMEPMNSTQSEEPTPTVSTMPVKDNNFDAIDPVAAEPLLAKQETDVNKVEDSQTEAFDNDIAVSPVASIDSNNKLEGPKESEKSDEMEASKEELTDDEPQKDDDDSVVERDNTVKGIRQENQLEPEAVVTEDLATLDSEVDKIEGTTKVRDDVDEESDGESIVSLEPRVNESRPVTIQSKSAIQPVPIPLIAKSIYHTAERKSSVSDSKSMLPPKIPKRVERASTIPPNETPVIETARSVSAPFLKSARVESKPVTAKKVNVGGGGSVSQRIRQFQQLATNQPQKTATFTAPPRTPTRSRSNSPIPEFLATRPQSSMSNKSPPRVNSISHMDLAPTPSALAPASTPTPILQRQSVLIPTPTPVPVPTPQRNSMPPPPLPKEVAPPPKFVAPPPTAMVPPPKPMEPVRAKLEIIEKDNKPQLQVTTKINWDAEKQQHTQSPNVSPKGSSGASVKSASLINTGLDAKPLPQKIVDVSPMEPHTLRRTSVDVSAINRRQSTSEKERPRLFSRSSKSGDKDKDKDLGGEKKTPEPMSATAASAHTTSPATSAAPTLTRRSSTASTKSPKSPGFLKRVSSTLSRKKDSSPPPRQVPVESAKKTYLHVGSINVQLPDTMLWKRRFMKIDSDGWLCLSLTDDEV